MAHSLNCPNCGAPLDYDGNDPIIRCPYCNSSVIVPENLRAKPSFSSKPSNLTFGGAGDLGGLINQARRINEVKNLSESGRMDEAVALYREITGSDEFSARQAVGKLSTGQPITLAGMSASEVISQVRMAGGTGFPVQTLDRQTSQKVGRWVGCLVTMLVLGILASVLIPVGFALLGALAASNNSEEIFSVNIPGLDAPLEIPLEAPIAGPLASGFAVQELAFGGEGTGPGKFGDVRAIAVDPLGGNIYAANYDDGRVQVFDAQGNFQTQWIIPKQGSLTPYFDKMAAGRDGMVYIPVFGKILKFDSQGNALDAIEHKGYRFEDLDIALDGSMVAIANGEDIVWLTADGEIEQVVEDAVSTVSGDSELSSKIAVDGLGKVYVLGRFNDAVFIFGPDGKFSNRFGSAGDQPGQFRAPYAIEVDAQGRIFVSAISGIQVFSNDGRYLDVIKVKHFAYGLAFDDQGKLYITTNQKMVEKFSIKE
jgi:DNA-binding beta-propeller fold protein YncE/DNA-directed RNA polymerase subunit RPC12/RpoP